MPAQSIAHRPRALTPRTGRADLAESCPPDREERRMFRIGDDGAIPAARYFSREFFELEREKLWPDVWQVACRLEEIPRVGDFTEYSIVDQSILVVRSGETSVKAYFNACRHRGVQLGCGSGTFRAGQIVCPFHGWRWNLDGSNSYVYGECGFAPGGLQRERLRLRECRAETRWGLVFVHMDPDAAPLDDWLGGVKAALDPLGLERMRVRWWRYVELRANWKVVQEAFLEAYHIMQTHPEIAMFASGDDFDAECFASYGLDPAGHGWQTTAYVGGEQHFAPPVRGVCYADWVAENNRVMLEGTQAWITERQVELQEQVLARGSGGERFLAEFIGEVYADAARSGVPLPPPAPEASGHSHVFPNTTLIASYGNALIYKFRPHGLDPESTIFDVWSVGIPPASEPEPPRPAREGPVPVAGWPYVLRQDMGNIERQQRGLHTRGFDHCLVSPRYEPMILNMHRALDRYLAR
jgi:phenylpropionate dioxygenase-like ring-hydroxylating dioxygenase large terminal subunit